MPEPRVAHALFCDEIRIDADERMSFVGVRTGDFVVGVDRRGSELCFAAVVWLICDPDDVPDRIQVRVYGPPGRRLISANDVRPGPAPRRSDSTKAFIQLVLERLSLNLSQDGDVEVSIETPAGILRAGRCKIRFVSDAGLQPVR